VNRESTYGLILLCVLAAAPGLAFAQDKPQPKPRADEPVGRMFFTPAQRAQLDIARTQRARVTLATEKTEEVATAAPVPQTLTYDGVVRRADGSSTVWINSRPVNPKDPAGPVIVGRVRADGGISLQMPQTGRTVDLKPGQSVELLSGQIEERFARKPAPPEPKPAAKAEAKGETRAEAKGAPTAPAEGARAEREREDRERQRVDEAVTRALQEKGGSSPPAATGAGGDNPR
jgi:hypothetical protein